jgi:DNA replication ATP-dependent helicase Dna2
VQALQKNGQVSGMIQSGLEVSTIDKYQGRDKSIIIISCVVSKGDSASGVLFDDVRRLNVAASRAKKKLIFFGSFESLHATSQTFSPVLQNMRTKGQIMDLPQNALEVYGQF